MKPSQGVRITHIPTGIVIESIEGHTLEDNRLWAMTELTEELRKIKYGSVKFYIPPLDDLRLEVISSYSETHE